MSWSNKSKTLLQKEANEIITPDGHQILVGASESDVLLIEEGFNYFTQKTKTTLIWNNKTKITT